MPSGSDTREAAGDNDALGIAAGGIDPSDALAEGKPLHAIAQGEDAAGAFDAQNLGVGRFRPRPCPGARRYP